ncbi:unnamed protein product [Peniophora sp. CBMAI 1063]|nr:unnamed protein product [Peniophora sp. CBMAI 1063]
MSDFANKFRRSRLDIPPATSGRPRSQALQKQIGYLDDFKMKDYFLFHDSDPGEDGAVSIDELPAAAVFIHMRNKVMTEGHEGALLYFYRVLQRSNSATSERMYQRFELDLRRQIKREYGEPAERMFAALDRGRPPTPPEVTVEEVKRSLRYLKDLGRFKEELEYYVPEEDNTSQMMGLQVGPMKDVTAIVHFPKGTMPPQVLLDIARVPKDAPSGAKNRNERRAAARAKAKKSAANPTPGALTETQKLGPNFEDWKLADGVEHSPALKRQIAFLRENPKADYILWGKEDDPINAYALEFQDFVMGGSFAGYRRRLFMNGGSDQYSLAYLILTLVPAVRRRKITLQAISTQLRDEFGKEWVDQTLESIDWSTMLWKSHLTGKPFRWDTIPNCQEDLFEVMPMLKALGRYPDYLGRMTNEMIRNAARKMKEEGQKTVSDIGNGRSGPRPGQPLKGPVKTQAQTGDVERSLQDLALEEID